MVCPFGWLGPAWGGQLGLRRVVVAAPEERTRDYGIHNRRHEHCIALSKRGPERPKPFPLQYQHPSCLLPRATPAAAGVWAGIEPRSEWQAALWWWRGYSKAFEVPLLGPLNAFPWLNLYFLSGDTKNGCLPLWKSVSRSLYTLCFKSDHQTLAFCTASASLTMTMDTAILSASASLSIMYPFLHTRCICWSWCYRWGC